MVSSKLLAVAEKYGSAADEGELTGKESLPIAGQYQQRQTARAAAVQQTMQQLKANLERGEDLSAVVACVVTGLAQLAEDGDTWQAECMGLLEKYQSEYEQLSLLHETSKGKNVLQELRETEARKVMSALDKLSAVALRLARLANDESTALQNTIDGTGEVC